MIGVVLYCFVIDDWEKRFTRQISRLKSSDLYDNADDIYVVISDVNNNKKEYIEDILKEYPKIKMMYHIHNRAESLALMVVDDLCRSNQDYKVFYFHSKGVFNKYKNFVSKEIDPLKVSGVDCWVEMMEYFLLDNWKTCVQKLESYDTVGVTNNQNWWWGNFWWTKSSHIKKNIPIKDYYGGSRWQCEGWLHDSNSDKESIKKYEFFNFTYDPHYTVIPSYFYNGEDISDISINIIEAKFGYFSEQRDEGRGLLHDKDLILDVTEQILSSVENVDKKRILNDWNKFNLEVMFLENFGSTLASTLPKTLRIKFSTNVDPENTYIISSFFYHLLDIGYK